MYILVNKDIEISKGKLAGQVGHAVASYLYEKAIKPLQNGRSIESLDDYMINQKKIVLKCSQKRLEALERDGYISVRDNGLTELEAGSLTCVNYGIVTPDIAPNWLKRLRLYN